MASSKHCNRSKNSLPYFQNAIERSGHSSQLKEFMSVRFESSQDLFRVDLQGHYGCVNAIEFSNKGGEFVVSGGDDRRVLLWNVDKTLYRKEDPVIMKGQHRSNIFCTVFDSDNRHIFSAGNDDQAMRHDILTRETLGVYFHDHPVYGLNVHPEQENIFLTACDNGKVQLWDARNTSQSASQCLAHYHQSAFHAAVFNPMEPILIATANSIKGVQLWDVRFPERVLCEFRNGMPKDKVCAMGVKWNSTGTRLSALRRRLPPVLYSIEQTTALAEFKHPGYNNICTMKSHCFAGDKDQYIISGSDDFNVYLWKVPNLPSKTEKILTVNKAMLILSGHRSIVNQVRFNPTTHMIISAGVEKIVKLWSPWYLPGAKGDIHKKEKPNEIKRELYSHDDYVDLVLDSGQPLTHEYEGGSVDEDPRMLAFFDTLIQREQGGWNSDSDSNISEDDFYSRFLDIRSSDVSDSDSDRVSAQRLRDIFNDEARISDESDETSQAVLRRMRRLRRAAFLRGLVRGSGHQEEAEQQDDNENQSNPSDSHNAFIRHLTREIMREALESSSDSSDSEPTVTLALPEELLEDDDNNNTTTERVEFRPSRSRRSRQYRTRRSSSRESSPQATSTANEAPVQSDTDILPPQGKKRRESSSSSSEDDSHEDESRTNQLSLSNKRKKRTRIHEEPDNEQTNGGPSLFASTSNESNCGLQGNAVVVRHSCVCPEHMSVRQVDNHENSNVEGGHDNSVNVNHNGHKHDGHHHHSQTTKVHSSTEGENVSLDGKHDDFNNT